MVAEAALRGQIAATGEIVEIARDSLGILRRQQALGRSRAARLRPRRRRWRRPRRPSRRCRSSWAATPSDRRAGRPHSERAAGGAIRSRRAAVAAGIAGQPAVAASSSSAPTSASPRRSCTPPARRSASQPPTGCRRSRSRRQGGFSATTLSELFVPGAAFWTLAGNVAHTIFDAGTAPHTQRAAEAALDQAAAQYRRTVLTAFQNVADALRALESDADALKAVPPQQRPPPPGASPSPVISSTLGAVNYLALLNAEQTYQQARLGLVQAEAARFADSAALFQALGGGWWNRRAFQL